MAQQHDTGSGTLATLVTGAVLGAAGLAWWLLNEADRRRRYGAQKSMLHAPRMQDGSEVLDSAGNGHLEEERWCPDSMGTPKAPSLKHRYR